MYGPSLYSTGFATSLAPPPDEAGERLAASDDDATGEEDDDAAGEEDDAPYVPPDLSKLCCCGCGSKGGGRTVADGVSGGRDSLEAPVGASMLEGRLEGGSGITAKRYMTAPPDSACVLAVSVWEGEILRPLSGRCHRAFFGHPEHAWEAPRYGRNVTEMVNRYLMNTSFIAASNGLFSDACIGVRKKLFVDFDTSTTLEQAQATLVDLRAQLAQLEHREQTHGVGVGSGGGGGSKGSGGSTSDAGRDSDRDDGTAVGAERLQLMARIDVAQRDVDEHPASPKLRTVRGEGACADAGAAGAGARLLGLLGRESGAAEQCLPLGPASMLRTISKDRIGSMLRIAEQDEIAREPAEAGRAPGLTKTMSRTFSQKQLTSSEAGQVQQGGVVVEESRDKTGVLA